VQTVTNPDRVASHDFYPFIKRLDQTPRYKPDEGKVKHKSRRICYAAHLDAHIYAYYSRLLSGQYEARVESADYNESIVAYRSFGEIDGESRCNIHFAKDVFEHIYTDCKPDAPLVALAFDVKGFFDNLDHGLLKKAWSEVLQMERLPADHFQVFCSLTEYAYVKLTRLKKLFSEFYEQSRNMRANKNICTPAEFREKVRRGGHIIVNRHGRGIPQGTPISALLSNIYMRSFDKVVFEKIDGLNGLYRRYSDDLIVVVSAEYEEEVECFVMDKIKELNLRIQALKTESYIFDSDGKSLSCKNSKSGEGAKLQYLGFDFDGENIRIRPSSLTRFYRRMNGAVKAQTKRAIRHAPDGEYPRFRKSSLYERFSHLGECNFITYAYRADEVMKEVTGRSAIRSQVSNHWKILNQLIADQQEELSAAA
jgi:hypothetical protein